jgi:hypothetical protein
VNVATRDAFSVPVPMVVPLSLNVTVPVGVPVLPVELSATVALNVTDAPELDGLDEETSVVVVVAWFTTSEVVVSVKPLTLALPL